MDVIFIRMLEFNGKKFAFLSHDNSHSTAICNKAKKKKKWINQRKLNINSYNDNHLQMNQISVLNNPYAVKQINQIKPSKLNVNCYNYNQSFTNESNFSIK